MPRAAAKKKVRMCQKCNGEFTEQFQKLLEGKDVTVEIKCIGGGKCNTKTPICRVDQGANKTYFEADTVEELAAKIG